MRECTRNQEVLREFVTLGDIGFADVLSTLLARKTLLNLRIPDASVCFMGLGLGWTKLIIIHCYRSEEGQI